MKWLLSPVHRCLWIKMMLMILVLSARPGCPGQRVRQSPLLGDVRKPPPGQGAGAGLCLADWRPNIELSRRELAHWPPGLARLRVVVVAQVDLPTILSCQGRGRVAARHHGREGGSEVSVGRAMKTPPGRRRKLSPGVGVWQAGVHVVTGGRGVGGRPWGGTGTCLHVTSVVLH